MEEQRLTWDYEPENIEELIQKLAHATLELEAAHKTNTELLHLLTIVSKERDELRHHLLKLQTILTASYCNTLPLSHPSSSDFPTSNVVHCSSSCTNLGFVQTCNFCSSSKMAEMFSCGVSVKEFKDLPEKGKLLQSVMEAGPLLLTLLNVPLLP